MGRGKEGIGSSWRTLTAMPLTNQFDRRSFEKVRFALTTALGGAGVGGAGVFIV